MNANYDAVFKQIFARMKPNVSSRSKVIQRYVENEKCKSMIAQVKINNQMRIPGDNNEDSEAVEITNFISEQIIGPRQLEFVNIVKDQFIDEFDADGALMNAN